MVLDGTKTDILKKLIIRNKKNKFNGQEKTKNICNQMKINKAMMGKPSKKQQKRGKKGNMCGQNNNRQGEEIRILIITQQQLDSS